MKRPDQRDQHAEKPVGKEPPPPPSPSDAAESTCNDTNLLHCLWLHLIDDCFSGRARQVCGDAILSTAPPRAARDNRRAARVLCFWKRLHNGSTRTGPRDDAPTLNGDAAVNIPLGRAAAGRADDGRRTAEWRSDVVARLGRRSTERRG